MAEAKRSLCSHAGFTLYKLDYWYSSYSNCPVYPYCLEESSRNTRISFHEKHCRFMMVIFVIDGEVLYADEHRNKYLVNQGKILVIPLNAEYSFATTAANYCHKIVLEIKGSMLAQLLEQMNLSQFQLLDGEVAAKITQEVRCLGDKLKRKDEQDVPELLADTWKIMNRIALSTTTKFVSNRLLEIAKLHLKQNLSSAFTIAKLANNLGICHSLLDRLFQHHLGLSPQQYRTAYKLEQARHLLTNTSLSIKEIAVQLGYSNQHYFSNDFKKHHQLSPKNYRQQQHPTNGNMSR